MEQPIQNNPLVSIIITSYNYGCYLPTSITSALNQTYKNVEVIVVNDGSTDNTDDVVEQYKDKIQYIKQQNAGASSARNTGIRNATGTWILPLDGDDWISPCYIEDAVKLIEDYKTVIFARYYYADENLQMIEGLCKPPKEQNVEQILETCTLSFNVNESHTMTPTSLYSKALWELCGGYNKNLLRAEDWEYNINMLSNGAKLIFMEMREPYFKYRHHEGSKSTKYARYLEHTRRFINQRYGKL